MNEWKTDTVVIEWMAVRKLIYSSSMVPFLRIFFHNCWTKNYLQIYDCFLSFNFFKSLLSLTMCFDYNSVFCFLSGRVPLSSVCVILPIWIFSFYWPVWDMAFSLQLCLEAQHPWVASSLLTLRLVICGYYLMIMQIVQVAIWLSVQESYGLGVKTVEKPFCPRLGTPVQLAMR